RAELAGRDVDRDGPDHVELLAHGRAEPLDLVGRVGDAGRALNDDVNLLVRIVLRAGQQARCNERRFPARALAVRTGSRSERYRDRQCGHETEHETASTATPQRVRPPTAPTPHRIGTSVAAAGAGSPQRVGATLTPRTVRVFHGLSLSLSAAHPGRGPQYLRRKLVRGRKTHLTRKGQDRRRSLERVTGPKTAPLRAYWRSDSSRSTASAGSPSAVSSPTSASAAGAGGSSSEPCSHRSIRDSWSRRSSGGRMRT